MNKQSPHPTTKDMKTTTLQNVNHITVQKPIPMPTNQRDPIKLLIENPNVTRYIRYTNLQTDPKTIQTIL